MADVVVLGGCIIDLISYASRFPNLGETLAGNSFAKGFGGKGANQCVMSKRLGANTALIAKLGNDAFGIDYLQNMNESGIICDFITMSDDSQTSTASICVTEQGENCIIYVPGAIMKLTPEDVKKAENLIKSAKLLVCTYEATAAALSEALLIARKHNVMTLVNAAPYQSAEYDDLHPLIDILCVNEVEASQATGICISNLEEAGLALKLLLKKYPNIILTLGEQGAVYQNRDIEDYVHVSTPTVKPVDSTGAGDAFVGSLAYFLATNLELSFETMVHRSCMIATSTVLRQGTQSSFPNREDVIQYLQS